MIVVIKDKALMGDIANRLSADVIVECHEWPDISALINKCFDTVTKFDFEGFRGGQIAVLLTNDASMRQLNTQFRNIDKPTNVLSFPATDLDFVDALQTVPFLGDLALGLEITAKEAKEKKVTFEDHVAHLIFHGCLHLLGYDHQADEEAEIMENHERMLLNMIGVSDPYSDLELHNVR